MTDKVSLLTVGTEIIEGQIVDRNSSWISQKLFEEDIEVAHHISVRDDRQDILNALDFLFKTSKTVILTGGLGPTQDDFTREVIADHAKRQLVYSDVNAKKVSDLLTSRGVAVTPVQKRQSWFPEGAKVHTNAVGTAVGFSLEADGKNYLALPGPPREIMSIWESGAWEWLLSTNTARSDRRRYTVTFLGLGESTVAEKAEAFFKGQPVEFGYRAHQPFVEVKFWFDKNDEDDLKPLFGDFKNEMKSFWAWDQKNDYLKRIKWKESDHLQTVIVDASLQHSFFKRITMDLPSLKDVTFILKSKDEDIHLSLGNARLIEFSSMSPDQFELKSSLFKSGVETQETRCNFDKKDFQGLRFSEFFAVEKALQRLAEI